MTHVKFISKVIEQENIDKKEHMLNHYSRLLFRIRDHDLDKVINEIGQEKEKLKTEFINLGKQSEIAKALKEEIKDAIRLIRSSIEFIGQLRDKMYDRRTEDSEIENLKGALNVKIRLIIEICQKLDQLFVHEEDEIESLVDEISKTREIARDSLKLVRRDIKTK